MSLQYFLLSLILYSVSCENGAKGTTPQWVDLECQVLCNTCLDFFLFFYKAWAQVFVLRDRTELE